MPSRVLQEEFARLDWVQVDSSNVEAVAYYEPVGRLWVRFLKKGGRGGPTVYVYHRVEPEVYSALLSAASKGGYHAANIKGRYGYEPFI